MFIHREMTAEEFLLFADQHPDKRFDFIDGEMVEVWPKPMHGKQQVRFASALNQYLEAHPELGLIAYTEVLHELNGEKFLPDVCANVDSDADYLTTPPLFIVEIRSESQTRASQRRKMQDYLRHGVKLGVLVLPGEAVEVYQPGKAVQTLTADDTLYGGDVLSGFNLPLNRILL